MRSRATLVLAALLVVLGAAAALVAGPCSADRPREHGRALPGLAPADVQTIRIARSGAEVLLARAGSGWKLGAAKEAADAAAVDALLADLAALEVSAVVSKNAAKQEAYETDAAKGIVVRLEGAGGKLVAGFTVGKRGPDFASAYLKRDGAKEVLLVSRDVRTPLAKSAENWKEPPKPPAATPPSGQPKKP
ncbi:MAG TPA: DUF4340 domain-containing protein [bacterium]